MDVTTRILKCEHCGKERPYHWRVRGRRFCYPQCSNEFSRRYRGVPLTPERLRQALNYDQETGIFTRLYTKGLGKKGLPAGHVGPQGYRKIVVDARSYPAGHLAWLFVYGVWPGNEIDHRNCNPDDNRIENLRVATNSQQKANSRCYRNNQSGLKGARRHGRGWRASVRKDGKIYNLGVFPTPEDAHKAYVEKAKELHGEFARAT